LKQKKGEASFRMMLKVTRKQLRNKKWDKSEMILRKSSKTRKIVINLKV
jgi:hypothetical protein